MSVISTPVAARIADRIGSDVVARRTTVMRRWVELDVAVEVPDELCVGSVDLGLGRLQRDQRLR